MKVIVDDFGVCAYGRAVINSVMPPCMRRATAWVHDVDDDSHPGYRCCLMHARFFEERLIILQMRVVKESELAEKISARMQLELREEHDAQESNDDAEVPSHS